MFDPLRSIYFIREMFRVVLDGSWRRQVASVEIRSSHGLAVQKRDPGNVGGFVPDDGKANFRPSN